MEKFSLLYVDDEESNLRIFKNTFRRKFEIYTATSAKEGMKILDNHEIDLVLSDQRMPGMTGVEFLRYTLNRHPKPNRILITGYSDLEAIENAINHAHIFQYIPKPWNEEHLMKVIEDALRIYQLEKENEQQKQELIRAKEKAEASDRLKTEFINNLSHEIRTPMNGIIGFSNLLGNFELSEEKKSEYVRIIQNSGKRLLKIIDNILEISQLGTKQIEVTMEKIPLNNFCKDLHSIFSIEAGEKETPLYLHLGLKNEGISILSDGTKLSSILSQLIENALKFTEKGRIDFGYEIKNEELLFFVKDTGRGIKPENIEEVFKKFVQEYKEQPDVVGGLGLGLAIAKEHAEIIGGKLSIKSEPGKGSEFNLIIPFLSEETNLNKDDQHNELNEEIEKSNKMAEYTILVAEDDMTNFLYLNALLTDEFEKQCNILHALDGNEAVKICKDNKEIKMVLMDIKMPYMNGYEATKEIKRINSDIVVIAQTAYVTEKEMKKAKEAGCDGFVTKPIDADELLKSIQEYLKIEE